MGYVAQVWVRCLSIASALLVARRLLYQVLPHPLLLKNFSVSLLLSLLLSGSGEKKSVRDSAKVWSAKISPARPK